MASDSLNVGIYARVSTSDKQNIESQISYLKEYAYRKGLNVVGVYADVGESGKKDSRPEFDRLMSDVRSGRVNGILVQKLDRIGRSLLHLVNLFQEFKRRHVTFISATQNIDTTTPEGRMFLNMMLVLAEYERELIGDRVRVGLELARKRGKRIGRPKGRKDSKPRRKSGYYLRWQRDKKTSPSFFA